MKKKLVFAGGRKLGTKVLNWLCMQDYIDIIGVCPLPEDFDGDNYLAMCNIITDNKLRIINMSEVKDLDFDIGLSVNYHRIISAETIEKANIGFYNIHHSYNLRLRGRNITTFAILNSRKENIFYHGTTLHQMVAELDAGPIVATKACAIEYTDTAYTLFKKVDELAYELICEWIPRIATQTIFPYSAPMLGIHEYRNKELPNKELDIEALDSEDLYDIVRSFDFVKYEPVYFIRNNIKIHLVLFPRDEYNNTIQIKGKIYYTE